MAATQTERLPWCDTCNCFAVPTDDGECGECGSAIRLREGPV